MNLDDRARRAARALHDATPSRSTDLDLTAERVSAGAASRRRRIRGVRIAAVALLGITAVALDRRAPADDERIAIEDPRPPTSTTTPETTTTEVPDPSDPRDGFALVPASPIDGLDSYRLPVIAIAQSGLTDGQTITVLGKGFEAGERLGIVQCASEAILTGAAACDLTGGDTTMSYGGITYADADANGEVDATFVVKRQLPTGDLGMVDCASAAERCMVGIGALSNYDRSGSTFINFADAPPFPQPTVNAPGATAHPIGMPLAIEVSGWLPNRSIRLQQCVHDICQTLADGYSTPDGTFSASPSLTGGVAGPDVATTGLLPCDDRCTIRAVPIDIPEATGIPSAPPLSITFVGTEAGDGSVDGRAPTTSIAGAAPVGAETTTSTAESPRTTMVDATP
jgi:hypothetical protein